MEALGNRWIQLVAAAVVAAVLATAVTLVLSSSGPSDPTLGPVKLTTGGTVAMVGGIQRQTDWASRTIVEEELPLTAAEAVAAGWQDPILCSVGRGRYFKKTGGEEVPYILMYDSAGDLIGLYQYLVSETEIPAPWERTEEISGGAGPVLDYEHWGLFVYFRDPLRACTTRQGGCGSVETQC